MWVGERRKGVFGEEEGSLFLARFSNIKHDL